MNILSVNKFYWRKGGSESVFFNEMEMLEKNGHQVIPFSMHNPDNLASPYSEYFVDEVDYDQASAMARLKNASKIIYSFDARTKMKHLLDKCAIDLSHFHIFQHQISPSVFGPLKKKGIPIVLTLHDLKPICPNYKYYVNGSVCEACNGGKFYNCFKNKCTKGSTLGSLVNTVEMYFHYAMGYYQGVDRYIAVSKFYKQKMMEAGFPEQQIAYLPNYIDTQDFDATLPEQSYVLYFGRLSEEKGVSTLFQSARENSDIRHLIVGTGPLEQSLKQEASALSLENVEFLGFRQGNELKKLLSEATCVVVPSEWYENCPMTILEAFAAGRPVIGADIGGIPELIEQGQDGFTFEPKNAAALAEKVRWVWENRSQAREMGMAGRAKILEKFNAEQHYEGLMSVYKAVL